MKIVGCDLHTRYQQIAMLDKETGELIERRLEHESGTLIGVFDRDGPETTNENPRRDGELYSSDFQLTTAYICTYGSRICHS